MTEFIEAMKEIRFEYQKAVARNSAHSINVEKERMKNAAFNHYDELLRIADEYEKLKEENKMLEDALAEADAEIKSLRNKKPSPSPKKG